MMLMEHEQLEAVKAAESGKAIEIDGRAYFTRNDL